VDFATQLIYVFCVFLALIKPHEPVGLCNGYIVYSV